MYTFLHIKKEVAALTLVLTLISGRAGTAGTETLAELERLCAAGNARQLKTAFEAVSADVVFPSGNRPLHVAAEHASDPAVIELLVKKGASLSAEGLEKLTPLMLAAAYNPNPKVTESLIRAGAPVNSADGQGRTPLYLASALNESPDVTAALLRNGASPNTQDKNGRTPLWMASARSDAQIVQLLLDEGAKADSPNDEGVTPLLAASEKPDAAVLRLLIEAGADAGRRGKNRYTPLMSAVAAGADPESIHALLDGGADVAAEDDQNRSAIHLLASRQDAMPKALALLIGAGANPNALDSSLTTPLMEACRQKNTAAVETLLKAGAKAGSRDRHSWTALLHAASKGAPEELYRLLIAAGADINEASREGVSALMIALGSNVDAENIRVLLKLGADPNGKSDDTISALMGAVAAGNSEIVSILLENGAAPDQSTWDGLSPLMMAAQKIRDTAPFDLFVKAGADLNHGNNRGMTALMVAAAVSNTPAVERLLALSADLTLEDRDGLTPLTHAVQFGEEDEDGLKILDLLISAGSDVGKKDIGGATPLMHAALRGKPEMAKRLLGAGARIDAKDLVGWTALHFAARSAAGPDVLRVLLERLPEREKNADVPDGGGTTPLMVAASYDRAEAVKLLLKAGADPARADRTGRSAYEYTLLKNAENARKILEEAK
ncbi:MAG: ankyrin repeat domain-containing protein [Synergistaceae bacterium]|nr:ankyrin repeat domain-containing protein [Synergistaceae bacterium]